MKPLPGSSASGEPSTYRSRLYAYLRARPELLALTALALVLRVLLVDAQSGWLDEAVSLDTVRWGWHSLVRAQLHDVHPLLYFLLLRLWLILSGTGLVQARLLSVLFGVALVPALYSLAERLFDRRTAIVTSLLLVVSPLAIWSADLVRMYALRELLALLAVRLLVEAADTQRLRPWAAFSICAVLAVNADYSADYLICGALCWYLLLVIRHRAALRPLLLSCAAMAVLSIPMLLVLHRQTQGQFLQMIAWIPAPTPSSVLATWRDLISRQSPHPSMVGLVSAALLALSAACCGLEARRRAATRQGYQLLLCIILAPLALPLLASLLHPTFITEQVATALFGLLLLFGRAIVLAWDRWRLLGALALAATIALNSGSLKVMASTQLNDDWRDAVPYVLRHSPSGTIIVFNPSWYRIPFDYYAGQLKPGVQEISSLPPVGSPQQPWPHASTVWLVAVPYWDPAAPAARYANPGPLLPRGWPGQGLTLTAYQPFAIIHLYRFSSR